MKRKIFAAFAALALLASAACAARLGDFTTFGLDGARHTEELLKDAKMTVFNVWGTFCGPCLREMPSLGELAAEMKPEGVQIVGVLCDWFDRQGNVSETQIAKAKELVEKTRADYLHILLVGGMESGFGSIHAIPQTYFVNRGGEILGAVTGAQSKERWRAVFREMLEKCD